MEINIRPGAQVAGLGDMRTILTIQWPHDSSLQILINVGEEKLKSGKVSGGKLGQQAKGLHGHWNDIDNDYIRKLREDIIKETGSYDDFGRILSVFHTKWAQSLVGDNRGLVVFLDQTKDILINKEVNIYPHPLSSKANFRMMEIGIIFENWSQLDAEIKGLILKEWKISRIGKEYIIENPEHFEQRILNWYYKILHMDGNTFNSK